MKNANERDQQTEIEALRNRLSKLSAASLRINESLDLGTVLQEILDSARSLTDARYGIIVYLDEKGQVEDFLFSGLTVEESQQFGCPDRRPGVLQPGRQKDYGRPAHAEMPHRVGYRMPKGREPEQGTE